MIRLHRLRRCESLVLMLSVGAASGCINSEKFTSGRLPYGSADSLAATAPRDPFLTGGAAPSNEQRIAATASTTQPSALTAPASQFAAMPASVPQMQASQMQASQMQAQQMQAPQYAMHAAQAGAPMTDMRQAAYTPSEGNPFNTSPTAPLGSPQMSPQMLPQNASQLHAAPSGSAIEQISYEMPVGMPAGPAYEANPFAEVQGQPSRGPSRVHAADHADARCHRRLAAECQLIGRIRWRRISAAAVGTTVSGGPARRPGGEAARAVL